METNAIYITQNFIRLTQAKTNKANRPIVKEYQLDISSFKREEVPLRLKAFLKENKIDSENLTLVIPRNQVSVRYLNLPSTDKKEIKRMVEYELSNLFPYKPEELIFDETVIERRSDGYSKVMLIVVQREGIESEVSLLKQAGLVPDVVGISTVSLFNQFFASLGSLQDKPPKDTENYLLVNLEDNLLDILIVHKGKLLLSRGLSLKQEEKAQRLIKELKESIDVQNTRGIEIDGVFLTGRGVDLKGLALGLEQNLPVKVEVEETICVTRGLALKTRQNALNINLLPGELKKQRNKSIRRRSVLYLITLLILNASLLANLVFLKLRGRQEYLYFLKSEISKIESNAILLQERMDKTQILKDYFDSGRLTLGLLSEIYRLAPDGIYLNSLEIRGQTPSGALVLAGQAKDAKAVLKFASSIKDSVLISKADVNYITKRKSLSGEVVDFEIRSTF